MPAAQGAVATGAGAIAPPPWDTAVMLLYPLTGLAAWLVWRRIDVAMERKRAALRRWGWQLLLSGLWPAALYGAHSPALATAVLLLTLFAVAVTLLSFLELQTAAALLLLPYGAWLCWAAGLYVDRFWLSGV